MADARTSTFTMHHDRCNPEEWVARDILALADFLRTGDLRYAARLSRTMGIELVMSEHHQPKGGTLQEVGFAVVDDDGNTDARYVSDNVSDIADDEDVTAVTRIYRSPTEYVARFATGDDDGNFESWEYEFKPTREEAEAFLASMSEEAT